MKSSTDKESDGIIMKENTSEKTESEGATSVTKMNNSIDCETKKELREKLYQEIRNFGIQESRKVLELTRNLLECHGGTLDEQIINAGNIMKLLSLNLWFVDNYDKFNRSVKDKILEYRSDKNEKVRAFGREWTWFLTRQKGSNKVPSKKYPLRGTPFAESKDA